MELLEKIGKWNGGGGVVLERQSQGKFGLWPNSLEISFLYLESYLISLALPNVDCSISLKCVAYGFFQSVCVCVYFKI